MAFHAQSMANALNQAQGILGGHNAAQHAIVWPLGARKAMPQQPKKAVISDAMGEIGAGALLTERAYLNVWPERRSMTSQIENRALRADEFGLHVGIQQPGNFVEVCRSWTKHHLRNTHQV